MNPSNKNQIRPSSITGMVLLSLKDVPEPFTDADLVVAAWRKFPAELGLAGYERQHPDSNKILSSVMGNRGLVRKGFLHRLKVRIYALTRQGRAWICRASGEAEPPRPDHHELGDLDLRLLNGVYGSGVLGLFNDGGKDEIRFSDACRFWGLAESGDIKGQLKDVGHRLVELDNALTEKDGQMPDGRVVKATDARVMLHVHRWMVDRFSRMLELLRSRNERSKSA